jgi:hypothetical protein
METLGHSQVSLTLNTYTHVLPALQKEVAAKMDAILAGSSLDVWSVSRVCAHRRERIFQLEGRARTLGIKLCRPCGGND